MLIRRRGAFFPVALVVLILVIILSALFGSAWISPLKLFKQILYWMGLSDQPGLSQISLRILFFTRYPRVITAVLVGSALAVSGAALQALFRNPLSSPEVMGVSAGAGLGAVLVICLPIPLMQFWMVPPAAIAGAIAASAAVYFLSSLSGKTDLFFILLTGLAISSFLSGLISITLLFAKEHQITQYLFWTMGALEDKTWDQVVIVIVPVLVGITGLWFLSRPLNAMTLGEENAWGLGYNTQLVKTFVLLLSSALTGLAVSLAGPIGFIGILVPHLVRALIGSDNRVLIPASAIMGALVLCLCDLIGRTIIAPHELRTGIVTALIGSPFFLYLIIRMQKKSKLGGHF